MPDIRVRYVVDSSQLHAAESTLHDLSKEDRELVESFKKVNQEAQKAGKAIDSAGKQGKNSVDGLGTSLKTVGGALAAYFSVQALISFGKQVVSVTSEFQKFEAVLTNSFGSKSDAQVALQQIQDFAATTPFSVREATEAFIKMQNSGLKPTIADMKAFADLSANAGKGIDQLAEAVNDATRFEFERLKEFFVDASVKGNKVAFTFKGVTTEVDKNAASIKAYLVGLGNLNGVAGATDAIMQTLDGQLNNLGDSFDKLLVTLGNNGSGFFSSFIKGATDTIATLTRLFSTTEQLRQQAFLSELGKEGEKLAERINVLTAANEKLGQTNARNNAIAQIRADTERNLFNLQEENTALLEKAKEVLEDEKAPIRERISAIDEEIKLEQKRISVLNELFAAENKEPEVIKKTEAELKKEAAARKKANDELERRRKLGQDLIKALQDEAEELSLSALKSKEDAEKAADEKQKKILERMDKDNKEVQDKNKAYNDEKERLEELHQKKLNAIREAATDLAIEIGNSLFELGKQNREAEANDLQLKREQELKKVGDDKQAQAFINAKFDRQEAAIKTRQAQADKQQAIFNVLINTASAIMRQLAATPLPAGAFLVAAIGAIGAIQAATIAARPIPKFKDGIIDIDGPGTSTSDSIMARLSKGESVMTAQQTDKYRPTLEAMRAGFNPDLLNKVAMMNYDAISKQVAGHSVGVNSETIEEAVSKGVAKAMRKIPLNHISMDKKGFQTFIYEGNSTTEILNNQFNK